jgi:hypothetical protein
MARLSSFLRERGFRVFTVPEAATILFVNGGSVDDLGTREGRVNFQMSVMDTQTQLEQCFYRLARNTNVPSVLICDRGTMDGKAYIAEEEWQEVMARQGKNQVELREGRYDAVIHLVTAANGAEEFYSLSNNEARTESIQAAIDIDKQTQRVWTGHPMYKIVDNRRRNFEEKMQTLVSLVGNIVGLPSFSKSVYKFMVMKRPAEEDIPVETQCFDVEKVYLRPSSGPSTAVLSSTVPTGENGEGEEGSGSTAGFDSASIVSTPLLRSDWEVEYAFIRKRSQGNMTVHGLTTVVRRKSDNTRMELKRIITDREYLQSKLSNADPTRHIVKQRRICFIWENASFHIHQYQAPISDLEIVHIQTEGSDDFVIPPWLTTGPRVSDDGDMSAFKISLKYPQNSKREEEEEEGKKEEEGKL